VGTEAAVEVRGMGHALLLLCGVLCFKSFQRQGDVEVYERTTGETRNVRNGLLSAWRLICRHEKAMTIR
jgi:hypothetical protein